MLRKREWPPEGAREQGREDDIAGLRGREGGKEGGREGGLRGRYGNWNSRKDKKRN